MKVYDAIVTVKHRISNVCSQSDLDVGLPFDQMVREVIEAEGLPGITDEFEIVVIERRERDV